MIDRRFALYGALVLLAGTVVVSTAGARPVQGFIEADSPVTFQGDLRTEVTDPTVWIRNPEVGEPSTPVILRADNVTVTRKTLEIRTAHADSPVEPVTVELPRDDYSSETQTVTNATIEITGLERQAHVLVGPTQGGALLAGIDGPAEGAKAATRLGGLHVVDGYRQMHDDDNLEGSSAEFKYAYEIDKDLVVLEETPPMQLAGRATSYVWEAHVLLRNETGTVASYDTGFRTTSSNMGTTQTEHYEYVTMELDGLEANLAPDGLRTRMLSPAMHVDVDGSVELDDPSGSLRADDGLYRTDAQSQATVDGNVSLALNPVHGDAGAPRMSVGVQGAVASTDLRLVDQAPLLSTQEMVAAGAGGATVLGLAAWYVASAKGAGLAAIPLVGSARRRSEEDDEAAPAPEEPGHLLFEPDRFTLYHLVKSRVGLSPDECEALTGIQDAREHLDLLAEHDLLRVLADQPRRYCVPGTVGEEMAERIVFLRRPEARRLGELLAVHGLTPEDQLVERAKRTEGPLKPKRVPELVQEFVRVGLAYREAGEDGYVVDPTDDLFACFERMGEGAVPKVS